MKWPLPQRGPLKPRAFIDQWDNLHTWQGSAHSVSGEVPERDLVAELRQVVAEVTGKPVEAPSRRIGFLP